MHENVYGISLLSLQYFMQSMVKDDIQLKVASMPY